MDKENKSFDIISFLFNNESFINGLLENLKKELIILQCQMKKKIKLCKKLLK